MITHDPENLNPCEKKKKYRGFSCNEHPWSWKPKSLWEIFFLQIFVSMRSQDPENINPCGRKKSRGFSCNEHPWSWKPKSLWKKRKSLEDLVSISTHDPENPRGNKKNFFRGFRCRASVPWWANKAVQGMMLFVVAAGATQVMMTLLLLLVSHLVAAFHYSSKFVHLRLCTRTPMQDHRIENMTLSERVLVKKMTDPGTLNPKP